MEDRAKAERHKLIIHVLGDTGIRVGELVKLRA
jgi:site-specific recombinase XerD